MQNKHSQLLTKLWSKELDMEQFLLECAKWASETVSECFFKDIPIKPKKVVDYENYPAKDSLNSLFFEDNPEIMSYYDIVRRIKAENRTLREWLMECYKLLIKFNCFAETQKIQDKLKEEVRDDFEQVGDVDMRAGG